MAEQEAKRYRTRAEDGREETVIELIKVTTFTPTSGTPQRAKGNRRWILLDGRPVNYVDDETFEIFDTEERLRKV